MRVLNLPPRPLEPLYVPKYQLSENPILRFEYRPNYVPYEKGLPEFDMDWTSNADGFRDRDYPLKKPAGVTRILVLGDSTTAGNGIQYNDDVYVKQLESRLNGGQDRGPYEVINMGVGGYNTMQEVEFLRTKGLKYNPDIVLIGFCVNDFDEFADGDVYRTLLKLNKHLDQGHQPPALWNTFLKYSRLAFFTYHRLRVLIPKEEMLSEYREEALQGQNTVESGLSLLSRLQREHGFRTLIFILPAFDAPFSKYQHHTIHQNLKDIARKYDNIPVIDLLEDFQKISDDGKSFGQDGVHPNPAANKLLAEILNRLLEEKGLLNS